MKSFYILAISFALMSFAYGQTTPFLPCADGSPAPIFFDNSCRASLCNFTTGTEVVIRMKFTAPSPISSMKLRITFVSTGDMKKVGTYETEENACENLTDAQCPLEAGQTATYSLTVIVPSFGTTYMGIMEHRMVDENNATVFCFNNAVLGEESSTN